MKVLKVFETEEISPHNMSETVQVLNVEYATSQGPRIFQLWPNEYEGLTRQEIKQLIRRKLVEVPSAKKQGTLRKDLWEHPDDDARSRRLKPSGRSTIPEIVAYLEDLEERVLALERGGGYRED